MKIAFAAAAALLGLVASPPSQAAVYTGFLTDGFFSVSLDAPRFEPRPLRIDFEADLTKVDFSFLTVIYDVGFEVTIDVGPDEPREFYGELYDISNDLSSVLTPTGFSLLIDTADNSNCDPYEGPDYLCDHEWLRGFILDGFIAGDEPVAYRYEITAVPEPTTWGLMIAGFAAAGGMLRRAKSTVGAVAA